MRRHHLGWAVLGLLIALAPAVADDPGMTFDQTLDQQIAILEEVAHNTTLPAGTPQQVIRDIELLRQGVNQLKSLAQRQDYANARRLVRSWLRRATSEDLKTICQSIKDHLDTLVDQQETPLLDRADDLLAAAAETCRTAESEMDIDAIADQLQDFRQFDLQHNNSRTIQRVRIRIDAAVNFLERWRQYLDAKQRDDKPTALRTLNDLAQSGFGQRRPLLPVTELRQMQRALKTDVRKQINQTLEQITAQLADAATAQQVQQLQDRLNEAYQITSYSNSLSTLRQRMDRSRNTINAWLAVLIVEEAGEIHMALSQLQQLQRNSYRDFQLISSKQLTAKQIQLQELLGDDDNSLLPQIDDLLAEDDLLERLPKLLQRIDALRNTAPTNNELRNQLQALHNDLMQIFRTQQAYQYRRYNQLWNDVANFRVGQHPWVNRTVHLQQTLTRRAIADVIGLDHFEPANDNETPAEGLLRLATEAQQQGDWPQVYRLLDLYARVFARHYKPATLTAELTACRRYLVGLQLEQFGQYEWAAAAYLEVLNQVGRRIPHQEAAQRLKNLQENQPQTVE